MKSAFPQTVKILAQQVREARVDYEAFETTCCYDGVHLSEEEVEHVESLLPELGVSHLDEVIIQSDKGGKKTAVRDAEEAELAKDFPKHFAKTRCVFLDKNGYCEIQKLSMKQGRHAWYDKPLTCWLHPLVLIPAGKWEERPVLTLVNAENDPQQKGDYKGFASCTHCGREDSQGQKAWKVLEGELRALSELCERDDVYGELSAQEVDWVFE